MYILIYWKNEETFRENFQTYEEARKEKLALAKKGTRSFIWEE